MTQQPKKTKISNYQAILQPAVSLDDHNWSYTLPDLPSPQDTNRLGLVKAISLKTDGTTHTITLQLQPVSSNRALRGDPLDKFILAPSPTSTRAPCATQPPVSSLLRAGITLQDVHYNFYGHSNSQLKSRTCFLYAASKDVIRSKVDALGEFGKMKTVQKKAKRIGLLFSSADVAKTVDPKWCENIPDVETKDYVFTDGCGLIAPALARELAKGAKIVFRNQKRRGPAAEDAEVDEEVCWGDDYSFSVVGSPKVVTPRICPQARRKTDKSSHTPLAISTMKETLLRKQQDHFKFLASARNDALLAFRFLAYVNRFDLAERVILESLDAVRPSVQSLIRAEHNKMINNRDEQKCRILIPQSRFLFGVCDAWGVLDEGECHVRITHESKGLPLTLMNYDVAVTRNPCLHPGDLQKFKAVQKDELSHLVDFFISWDKDIVPSTVSEAAEYPGGKEPVSFRGINDDDRLVYFAKFTSSSLGRAKNLYLDWARVNGPMSPECQQLNRLFRTRVDANRIRIPQHLGSAPKTPPNCPAFILDELHEAAKKSQSDLYCGDYTPETIEVLLSRQDLLVSKFELIQLTWRWCCENSSALEDFVHFFDFTLLNAEQKHSHKARIGGFMEAAAKAMELFHRKLIAYRVDERLTLGIYVPTKLEKARESRVDDHVRLLAFPHSQGEETTSRLVLPTKKNYQLYYDDSSFQLRYRNVEGVGDQRRVRPTTLDDGTNFDFVSSVALNKFSSRLMRHVGREIYVISNRDTNSLRNLDLWNQNIDTWDVIPLFEQNAKEYTVATLGDVDWATQPEFIRQIVRRELLVTLLTLDTKEQCLEVFSFLLDHGEKELLIRCFDYLLSSFAQQIASTVEPATVVYEMLRLVTKCPVLAISFNRLESWSCLTDEVSDMLRSNAEILLNAVIQAANTVGAAVIAPFQTILARITILPISTCGRLVELIALGGPSSEKASV
ncbi:RNA dependent RNA polymerase-domain-containing protein [Schizothecium vesticola]|uniref:RNA-dependent RNA polymerase n=1 Tax=Schizothecium vesticola TaxID=314040 RepID=A0AA40K0G4_9PEZI|nr:RNA dependent RNA polymerase-domain-containing protein [Schizothecium vesticola]